MRSYKISYSIESRTGTFAATTITILIYDANILYAYFSIIRLPIILRLQDIQRPPTRYT